MLRFNKMFCKQKTLPQPSSFELDLAKGSADLPPKVQKHGYLNSSSFDARDLIFGVLTKNIFVIQGLERYRSHHQDGAPWGVGESGADRQFPRFREIFNISNIEPH